MNYIGKIAIFGVLFTIFIINITSIAEAGMIDSVNKYAWSSDTGWINFHPSNGNVAVSDAAITGQAWSDNYGWIDLQPSTSGVTNIITNDGTLGCIGNLSGQAWNTNLGWLDFENTYIDSAGNFQGTAYGPLFGTVNFSGLNFSLSTTWLPRCNSSKGSSGSIRIFDRCNGDDTSGSLYDGSCGPSEEEIEEIISEEEIGVEDTEEIITEEEIEDTEQEVITQEALPYTTQNNFSSCTIVQDIKNPEYTFQSSGIFIDEDIMRNKEIILKFAKIGIINGHEDGSFQPNREITRSEFLKIALISHCYTYSDMEGATPYQDVEKNTWQAKVIQRAELLGMIHGDILELNSESQERVFRPNDIITKAEAIKILMRISHIQAQNTQSTVYKDITVDWHVKYVENGEALGLFDAYNDDFIFNPNSGMTREDMIQLIENLIILYG